MMYAVVVVLTTALISSTVAIKNCDDSIIQQLRTLPECYNGGNPPTPSKITETYNVVQLTSDKIRGEACTTIFGHQILLQITSFTSATVQKTCLLTETSKGDYYEERPYGDQCHDFYDKESKFKMYPIHHESQVYSYYRCIEGGATEEGGHMGVVAVHKDVKPNDAAAELVINKAKECFGKLGIAVDTVQPCPFQSEDSEDQN